MTDEAPDLLLDEHVSRIFERTLEDRGFDVEQAKDRFGERTSDEALLAWCGDNDVLFCSNDGEDFRELDEAVDHAGLLLYREQGQPASDPEGFALAVEAILEQYGRAELANETVDLQHWYEWHRD